MKSTDNRYRPARVRYELDDWRKKKTQDTSMPQFGKQAMGFGKRKKGKS